MPEEGEIYRQHFKGPGAGGRGALGADVNAQRWGWRCQTMRISTLI